MPADTFSDMILGFAVILSVLLVYVLSLIIRNHQAKSIYRDLTEE